MKITIHIDDSGSGLEISRAGPRGAATQPVANQYESPAAMAFAQDAGQFGSQVAASQPYGTGVSVAGSGESLLAAAGAMDGGRAPAGPAGPGAGIAGPMPFTEAGTQDFGMAIAAPDMAAGAAPGAAEMVEAVTIQQGAESGGEGEYR